MPLDCVLQIKNVLKNNLSQKIFRKSVYVMKLANDIMDLLVFNINSTKKKKKWKRLNYMKVNENLANKIR